MAPTFIFSAVVVLTVLSCSFGFLVSPNYNRLARYSSIKMSEAVEQMPTEFTPEPMPAIPMKKPRVDAKWFPFGLKAPILLDGTIPGDVGFDPLGFANSDKTLYWMRDAEVKHARLAMLAAVGWPLSELWHKNIASAFGLDSILANGDRAPSILNGGLSNGWAFGMLVMSILLAGTLEGKAMNDGDIFWGATKPKNYIPGDFKFDPLNLMNVRGKNEMLTAELKNGRLAMLAITAYAFQEFATKLPVVQETPYLF